MISGIYICLIPVNAKVLAGYAHKREPLEKRISSVHTEKLLNLVKRTDIIVKIHKQEVGTPEVDRTKEVIPLYSRKMK